MSKTFHKITNEDIYKTLKVIDRRLAKLNGNVKWHSWAIGFLVLLITAIIARIL